jgi:isopentenyl diphosphate isomerase/L-lactate dehydrogenase-like FMN-dependent dehydrogenase
VSAYPAGGIGFGQRHHGMGCAAKLKGAASLEVFALKKQAGAQHVVESLTGKYRRLMCIGGNDAAHALNVSGSWQVVQWRSIFSHDLIFYA